MIVAGPILLAILIVGLVISIFQVTTQLQEMTLSYVPKMIVTPVLLMLLGPWMMAQPVWGRHKLSPNRSRLTR